MKKHEEEVTANVKKHQENVALGNRRKRGGRKKQKIDCKLSHQGKICSAMAHHFIHLPSFPSFRMFRDEH